MKEYQIKNYKTSQGQVSDRGQGNRFSTNPVFEKGLLEKCAVQFVEVEPGNQAFGYHYHESVEEVFYIISGEAILRTYNGEVAVKAGDAISFPTGVGGTHVLTNSSAAEKLVFLDFGTKSAIEICHLPDVNKIMVASNSTFGIFDEPTEK